MFLGCLSLFVSEMSLSILCSLKRVRKPTKEWTNKRKWQRGTGRAFPVFYIYSMASSKRIAMCNDINQNLLQLHNVMFKISSRQVFSIRQPATEIFKSIIFQSVFGVVHRGGPYGWSGDRSTGSLLTLVPNGGP